MSECTNCGEEFPEARAKLGYSTCLECGELEAQEEKNRKALCSAPLYNKGGYGYIANKRDAMDAGK